MVEDDHFFQNFYSGKLREANFVVTVASNGEEGLERALEQQFNVILLDLIMPRVDGFTFLEKRRTLPALLQVPVLVFSTLGQEQDIEKAKSLGANDYVNKSFFDFEVLLAKIKATMKP